MSVTDFFGLVGVALILIAYACLQTGRMRAGQRRFSALNAVGAALILFTLYFDFNLSAVVIESAWLVISLYGIATAIES
ncbi:MAG: cyclic nucleotide-binding protein [Gammaproteobacteria bacterium]